MCIRSHKASQCESGRDKEYIYVLNEPSACRIVEWHLANNHGHNMLIWYIFKQFEGVPDMNVKQIDEKRIYVLTL